MCPASISAQNSTVTGLAALNNLTANVVNTYPGTAGPDFLLQVPPTDPVTSSFLGNVNADFTPANGLSNNPETTVPAGAVDESGMRFSSSSSPVPIVDSKGNAEPEKIGQYEVEMMAMNMLRENNMGSMDFEEPNAPTIMDDSNYHPYADYNDSVDYNSNSIYNNEMKPNISVDPEYSVGSKYGMRGLGPNGMRGPGPNGMRGPGPNGEFPRFRLGMMGGGPMSKDGKDMRFSGQKAPTAEEIKAMKKQMRSAWASRMHRHFGDGNNNDKTKKAGGGKHRRIKSFLNPSQAITPTAATLEMSSSYYSVQTPLINAPAPVLSDLSFVMPEPTGAPVLQIMKTN